MSWSFRVGRLAGINIFVHYTFLILLAWVAYSGYAANGNVAAALGGVLLIGAVFFIVVLHELGHAMAARYYGIPTRDITLLPIGGVARLERMPEKPVQELVVALAGPAVNVVLAGVFFVLALGLGLAAPDVAMSFGGDLVSQLFWINVGLAAFNLLPAFPMDGGRVLRALLAMRLGAVRATEIAARVGQGMAVLFVVYGLMPPTNLMLALLALFVWTGAEAELRAVRARGGRGASGPRVADLMLRRFAAVEPDDNLGRLAYHAARSAQLDFPVLVDGRLVGMVTREDLHRGMTQLGPDARVMQVMRRGGPVLSPGDLAERGLSLLAGGNPVVPVMADGQLAGLLTVEAVTEFLSRHSAGPGDSRAYERVSVRSKV